MSRRGSLLVRMGLIWWSVLVRSKSLLSSSGGSWFLFLNQRLFWKLVILLLKLLILCLLLLFFCFNSSFNFFLLSSYLFILLSLPFLFLHFLLLFQSFLFKYLLLQIITKLLLDLLLNLQMLCLCPYIKPNPFRCHHSLPISTHRAGSYIVILLWLKIDILVKLRHWRYMRRGVELFLKPMRHNRRLKFIRVVHLRGNPVLLGHWRALIYRLLLKLGLLELLLWRLVLRLINLHLILLLKALWRLHLLELGWLLHLWLRHPVLLKLLLLLWIVVLKLLLHWGRCWFVQISVSIRSTSPCFSKWILKIIDVFSFSSFFFFLL